MVKTAISSGCEGCPNSRVMLDRVKKGEGQYDGSHRTASEAAKTRW